jgi:hypothetical protein
VHLTSGPQPTLTDSATLSGGANPTGTITFTLFAPGGPVVDTETVSVNGNGTYTTPTGFTLPGTGAVTGTYLWNAAYSGDANNAASSHIGEMQVVSPASPLVTGTPSPAAVTLGTSVVTLTDMAVLSGGYNPTGTLTFTLIGPGGATPVDTETVSVAGNGTYTTPTGFTLPTTGTVTGTYQWHVTYNGDADNNPATGSGGTPVVSPASPTLTTAPGPAVTLGTATMMTDSATLAGGYFPTGTLTFNLFNPSNALVDTETVAVNGNGTYSTPVGFIPTATAGTYQWTVSYSGDGNNNPTSSPLGSEPEVVQQIHFTVTAPGTANAGVPFNFTVTALNASNNVVTNYAGTVRFTSSDPAATLAANSTLTNGTGTFSATLRTAGNQTITATDTVNSAITGTSNAIVVAPAAATHFTVSTPATTNAGTAFNFTVTALDPFNNVATGYTGTVQFTSSDPQATLPANSTLTNGVKTFSATFRSSGNQTITATDTVSASITGTSNATADAIPPPATPIPSTVWLASLGIAVLALWRRRRTVA